MKRIIGFATMIFSMSCFAIWSGSQATFKTPIGTIKTQGGGCNLQQNPHKIEHTKANPLQKILEVWEEECPLSLYNLVDIENVFNKSPKFNRFFEVLLEDDKPNFENCETWFDQQAKHLKLSKRASDIALLAAGLGSYGSPVLSTASGAVFAIVAHRRSKKAEEAIEKYYECMSNRKEKVEQHIREEAERRSREAEKIRRETKETLKESEFEEYLED